MKFEERFEELKKVILKNKPVLDTFFAIQINMTDEDCNGTFYIAYIDGELKVEPYDYHDHTAMITADSKILESILSGTLAIEKAYEAGNLIIEGSFDSAKELIKLCKKAPAKRCCTKKKAEKPEDKAETKAVVKANVKAEDKETKKCTKKTGKK